MTMALHKWLFVIGLVIWCIQKGQAQIELPWSIDVISDGTIAMRFEKEIRLYNEDLQLLDIFVIIPAEEPITIGEMEWSPDGQYVAISTYPGNKLQLWKYPQKIKVFEREAFSIINIVWSRDSQMFTTLNWRRVGSELFTYRLNGFIEREWRTRLGLGRSDWYSPNNVLVVPGRSINILDVTNFQEMQTLSITAVDPGISFNEAGNQMAFVSSLPDGSTNILQIWSYQNRSFEHFRTLTGHTRMIDDFAWHDNLIATYNLALEASDDTIQVWNA